MGFEYITQQRFQVVDLAAVADELQKLGYVECVSDKPDQKQFYWQELPTLPRMADIYIYSHDKQLLVNISGYTETRHAQFIGNLETVLTKRMKVDLNFEEL